jgi:hypothetical protein
MTSDLWSILPRSGEEEEDEDDPLRCWGRELRPWPLGEEEGLLAPLLGETGDLAAPTGRQGDGENLPRDCFLGEGEDRPLATTRLGGLGDRPLATTRREGVGDLPLATLRLGDGEGLFLTSLLMKGEGDLLRGEGEDLPLLTSLGEREESFLCLRLGGDGELSLAPRRGGGEG